MDSKCSEESQGVRDCSSLCLCWLGRGSDGRSRNIRRGTELLLRSRKGRRQGAEADPPLEGEGQGALRLVTK